MSTGSYSVIFYARKLVSYAIS